MGEKPKVSPNETIVFQDEDIEEYDELSLTGAIRDASKVIKKKLAEESEQEEPTVEDFDFDSLNPKD